MCYYAALGKNTRRLNVWNLYWNEVSKNSLCSLRKNQRMYLFLAITCHLLWLQIMANLVRAVYIQFVTVSTLRHVLSTSSKNGVYLHHKTTHIQNTPQSRTVDNGYISGAHKICYALPPNIAINTCYNDTNKYVFKHMYLVCNACIFECTQILSKHLLLIQIFKKQYLNDIVVL